MSRFKWGSPGPLDRRVLDFMSEFPGEVSFAGLRRTLGAHQESLSRTLHRLEREGQVERSGQGYRISERSFLVKASASALRFPSGEETPRAELRLEQSSDAERILGSMAGRWFGQFRWVGSVEDGPRTTLLWTSVSAPEQLALVIEGSHLQVYHRPAGTSAGEPESNAAYELLQHTLNSLGRQSTGVTSNLYSRAGEPRPPIPKGVAS